jgi:uncharacterized protein YigE (DUF2233 family)
MTVSGLLWPRATAELRPAWTAEGGRPYASFHELLVHAQQQERAVIEFHVAFF